MKQSLTLLTTWWSAPTHRGLKGDTQTGANGDTSSYVGGGNLLGPTHEVVTLEVTLLALKFHIDKKNSKEVQQFLV